MKITLETIETEDQVTVKALVEETPESDDEKVAQDEAVYEACVAAARAIGLSAEDGLFEAGTPVNHDSGWAKAWELRFDAVKDNIANAELDDLFSEIDARFHGRTAELSQASNEELAKAITPDYSYEELKARWAEGGMEAIYCFAS